MLFVRVVKIQCRRVFSTCWSPPLKVYFTVYLKAFLNILLSAKFKVKGLEFKSQRGIKF